MLKRVYVKDNTFKRFFRGVIDEHGLLFVPGTEGWRMTPPNWQILPLPGEVSGIDLLSHDRARKEAFWVFSGRQINTVVRGAAR